MPHDNMGRELNSHSLGQSIRVTRGGFVNMIGLGSFFDGLVD